MCEREKEKQKQKGIQMEWIIICNLVFTENATLTITNNVLNVIASFNYITSRTRRWQGLNS